MRKRVRLASTDIGDCNPHCLPNTEKNLWQERTKMPINGWMNEGLVAYILDWMREGLSHWVKAGRTRGREEGMCERVKCSYSTGGCRVQKLGHRDETLLSGFSVAAATNVSSVASPVGCLELSSKTSPIGCPAKLNPPWTVSLVFPIFDTRWAVQSLQYKDSL